MGWMILGFVVLMAMNTVMTQKWMERRQSAKDTLRREREQRDDLVLHYAVYEAKEWLHPGWRENVAWCGGGYEDMTDKQLAVETLNELIARSTEDHAYWTGRAEHFEKLYAEAYNELLDVQRENLEETNREALKDYHDDMS